MESELYLFHPPRSFSETEAIVEVEEEDPEYLEESSEENAPEIVKARSQPRKARPRMKKKTLKMTDFFGKQG